MDYQIGEHSINSNKSLKNGELIEFDYENSAIFKRLADDIYETPEAGIREPLQNGITAVKRSLKESYIGEDEGIINIKLYHGDQPKIVLKDNGIGISKSVLENVLSVIGRSQNRDSGNLSGKFGMGFLSFYKLVGTIDSGFWMYSRSRENEELIKGIWKPSGFELDTDGELPVRFDENEYGTQFELFVKPEIEVEDLRNWIEKHSKWSTIPIMYEEYDEDQNIVKNEDYGVKSISDLHEYPIIDIKNDYYRVISSFDSESKTLLLNSPIDRNSDYRKFERTIYPRDFDIRIKNENGIIIKGPNKGLMPVEETEYHNMDDSRKENYVPKSKINEPEDESEIFDNDTDISLPEPTGTREKLRSNEIFWTYINQKIEKEIKKRFKSHIDGIDSTEDFMNCSYQEKKFIYKVINSNNINGSTFKDAKECTKNQIRNRTKNKFSISLSGEIAKLYSIIGQLETVINRGSTARQINSRYNQDHITNNTVLDIITNESYSPTNTYMCITLNTDKMKAVWDENEENKIIQVDGSEYYSIYQDLFGWRKVKNIMDYIDKEDIDDDIYDKIDRSSNTTSNSKKPILDRDITIHKQNSGQKKKINYSISDIKEKYKKGSEKLILFPSNSDQNISDNYNMVSRNISISKCLVKMWDELKDVDNIIRIENWDEYVRNKSVKTTEGILSVSDLLDYAYDENCDLIFGVFSEDIDEFKDEDIMNELKDKNYKNIDSNNKKRVFATVLQNKMEYIENIVDKWRLTNTYSIYNGSKYSVIGNSYKFSGSNLPLFAWAVNPKIRDTEYLEYIDSREYKINSEWKNIVKDINPNNHHSNLPDPMEKTTYMSDNGEISVKTMVDKYDKIVLFAVPIQQLHILKDADLIEDIKEFILEYEIKKGWPKNDTLKDKIDNKNDFVLVPVSKDQRNHINNITPADKTHTIMSSYINNSGFNIISSTTAAYAYGKLSENKFNMIIPDNLRHNRLPKLDDGGVEFVNTFKNK